MDRFLIYEHIKDELSELERKKQSFEYALQDLDDFLKPYTCEIEPHLAVFELFRDKESLDKGKMKQALIKFVSNDFTQHGLGIHLKTLLEEGNWEELNFSGDHEKILKIYDEL